jgi:hypothetical protein
MTTLDELRKALDAPDGFDRCAHRQRTEKVRKIHANTVRYCELIDGSTCLTHALGIYSSNIYRAIAGPTFGYDIFAGKQFVEWLLRGHLKDLAQSAPDCLVLYFNGNVWKHAGIALANGRVVSQWGTFPLYEHETFEVPARYGDKVRHFLKPSPKDALALFVDFAKSLGIRDEDIAAAVSQPQTR